jgi:hypothetical protein
MTIGEEQLELEKLQSNRSWKYVWWLLGLCVVLTVFDKKHEDLIKMTAWTVIFTGLVLTYAWPFLSDLVSRSTVTALIVLHLIFMQFCYPRVPHHNFIFIGILIAIEFGVSVIPIAWLDVRSQYRRSIF